MLIVMVVMFINQSLLSKTKAELGLSLIGHCLILFTFLTMYITYTSTSSLYLARVIVCLNL